MKITDSNIPDIEIKFGENLCKGTITKVSTSDETGKTVCIYEYIVSSGDNGELSIGISENLVADLADNVNESSENKFEKIIVMV